MYHVNYVQLLTTSVFFYIEAIIHYNIGKFGKIAFTLPLLKENIMMLLTIIFFSFLACCLTDFVNMWMNKIKK